MNWTMDIESKNSDKKYLLKTLQYITAIDFRQVDGKSNFTFTKDSNTFSIDHSYDFLLKLLNRGDVIICHNIAYDIGCFVKLYDFNPFPWVKQFRDTMLLSQMVFQKSKLEKTYPRYPVGHSLGLWGKRLGNSLKIDFQGDYGVVTTELLHYLRRDTQVTKELYLFLNKQENYPNSFNIFLETYNAMIAMQFQLYGWRIDVQSLKGMHYKYEMKIRQIDLKLANKFLPLWVEDTRKIRSHIEHKIVPISHENLLGIPKVRKDYKKLQKRPTKKFLKTLKEYPYKIIDVEFISPYTNISLEYFKPNSRQSIIKFFTKRFNTKFTVLSATLNYKLDKDVLKELATRTHDEEKVILDLLTQRFIESKNLQQVITIEKGIYDYENGGDRIYPTLNILGASATGRSSSNNINFQNLDNSSEFRNLFICDDDYKIIDTDLSSAELVLLGHLLHPYDNGVFKEMLQKGNKKDETDFHSKNAKNLGIPRSKAKGVAYGNFYGMGGLKMGVDQWDDEVAQSFEYGLDDYDEISYKLQKRCKLINDIKYFPLDPTTWIPWDSVIPIQYMYGEQLKNNLNAGIIGMHDLVGDLEEEKKSNYLQTKILGGRKIYAKYATSPLNYALQSSNAVYTKMWNMITMMQLLKKGYKINEDFLPLAVIHDQLVYQAKGKCLKEFPIILNKSLDWINRKMNLNIPIECDTEIVDALTGHGG